MNFKKTVFSTIVFLLINWLPNYGQNVSWVVTGAGDKSSSVNGYADQIFSVVSDGIHIYATGLATGNNTTIGDTEIAASDLSLLFKFSLTGELIWYKELPGWGRSDLDIDSDGNIVVVGDDWFESYINKYDNEGKVIFEKMLFDGISLTDIMSVAIDKNNDEIVISGYYGSNMGDNVIGDSTLTDMSGYNLGLIAKFDSEGEFIWVNSTNGNSSCKFRDIDIDSEGNILAIGDYETLENNNSYLTISDFSFQSIDDPSAGIWNSQDVIIVKISSEGSTVWAKTLNSEKDNWGNNIDINSKGEIAVTGTFQSIATIDNEEIESAGSLDIFLIKMKSDGSITWIKSEGGEYGQFSNQVEAGRSVFQDDKDNIFLAGSIIGTVLFGSGKDAISVEAGGQAGFLSKYAADGSLKWVNTLSSWGEIRDIYVEGTEIYIGANFYPESDLFGVDVQAAYDDTQNFLIAAVNEIEVLSIANNINERISIFPNPTTDVVNIHNPDAGDLRVLIYNGLGQTAFDKTSNSSLQSIDVINLDRGIYFIRIENDTTSETYKLIKS